MAIQVSQIHAPITTMNSLETDMWIVFKTHIRSRYKKEKYMGYYGVGQTLIFSKPQIIGKCEQMRLSNEQSSDPPLMFFLMSLGL